MSEPAHAIVVVNTGEVYRCAADCSLLAGMEALGRRGIPVGCRGGGCGVCKVHIVSGAVRTGAMSLACASTDERAAGLVLACQAYPAGDVTVRAVHVLARRFERIRR